MSKGDEIGQAVKRYFPFYCKRSILFYLCSCLLFFRALQMLTIVGRLMIVNKSMKKRLLQSL